MVSVLREKTYHMWAANLKRGDSRQPDMVGQVDLNKDWTDASYQHGRYTQASSLSQTRDDREEIENKKFS